jgi:hypothetical protein
MTEIADQAKLSVGLLGAFIDPTPDRAGKFCRDDITFHVVDVVANTLFLDDYEVREVLPATIPFSYPLEQETGEVVMMSRSDNVGGPLPEDEAARIIARLGELGREHVLEGPLALLVPAPRAAILPPPSLAGTFELGPEHPLTGAFYLSVVDVLEILGTLRELDPERGDRVFSLLDFCRAERLALSWRRGGG